MPFLRDAPLRKKLTCITMLATGVALLVVGAAVITYELVMYRPVMTRELMGLADVIGANSSAALLFRDPKAGAETLEALRADPRIVSAAIYEKGEIFVTYQREHLGESTVPAAPRKDGAFLEGGDLTLFRPLLVDGKRIGTIYIRSDLQEVYARLWQYAIIVAVALAVSSLVALFLSSKLHGVIVGPILHLVGTARLVSEKQDYAIRAIRSGQDELGLLIDGFNAMLTQIQERDLALQQAQEELEERVKMRTSQLQGEITERMRAEEALKKLSSAVEQTADSVVITDRKGRIEYVNPAFETLTDYTPEEVRGLTPRVLKSGLHDVQFYRRLWQTLLAGQVFRAVFINRKKGGTLYYEDKTITPLRDSHGTITHFVSTGRDISQRMCAEEELRSSREQLRALAAHLESIREDERSLMAREVHDELGQMLTGLKIELSWIAARLPSDQNALRQKARAMEMLIDATIQSVRRISSQLRPGVLDDLGLVAAIEWQAQEFQARMGTECEFTGPLEEYELDPDLSTALFRILQEALTNVVRHAKATRVTILLTEEADRLILKVTDNGRGITEQELTARDSLGLLGMRERALLLGGEVAIAGSPGIGTTVRVIMPLKRSA